VTAVASPRRLLAATATSFREHLERVGPLPELRPTQIEQLAADAGLTGRGGAGFPTGRKLAAVAAGDRDPVVVANAAEGEPASSKDRALLLRAPHLVLDGLQLAVRATGATRAYVYGPSDLLRGSVRPALRQRRDAVRPSLVPAPDTFISGQETAVVAAVNNAPAVPAMAPPAVFEAGVRGRPTLVQNVETLAHLALIARQGATWFRGVGTRSDPGTRLVTLSGAVRRPGVYEVAAGTPLGAVLRLADGPGVPLQALLVGGYHGGWVPASVAADLRLSAADLAPYDAAPGAGVIIALPTTRCGLQAGADIADYLAGQNAGQCGPCRNGLPTIAGHLRTLAYRRGSVALAGELLRVCGLVDGRGACRHPDGTTRLVRSTLRTFREELDAHLQGRCSAAGGRTRSR
jgi:NADH:ubiquinone oxidoreductase subunit F (NADH-binding)